VHHCVSRHEKRRSASHPVVGATVFGPLGRGNEGQIAGLLAPRSSYRPRLSAVAGSQSSTCQQWHLGAFVARYSGATAWGFVGAFTLPSPSSLFSHGRSHGHCLHSHPQHIVGDSKNYPAYSAPWLGVSRVFLSRDAQFLGALQLHLGKRFWVEDLGIL
jgi:hypothetical protein